jgi:tetratricopeptide (TPR) repeat protein
MPRSNQDADMRKGRVIETIAFLLLGWTGSTGGSLAQAYPHVYLVRIPTADRKEVVLQTGFRLKGLKGIMTTLHGVLRGIADGTEFTATNDKNQVLRGLRVSHVDVARDLAILRCTQLERQSADGLTRTRAAAPAPGEQLGVVGHPQGIDLYIKSVTAGLPVLKKMRTLVPPSTSRPFLVRNSPGVEIGVLNIEGNLVPGDSGAPVLTRNHEVVGVVDGGLLGGAAGISWAIPLASVEWQPIAKVRQRLIQLADASSSNLFASLVASLVDTPGAPEDTEAWRAKFVLVVANFDGSQSQVYRLTDDIIRKVRTETHDFREFEVVPISETITEQEGSQRARELGQQHAADLVLWGYYSVSRSSGALAIHVENLTDGKYVRLPTDVIKSAAVAASAFDTFRVQESVAQELSAFVLDAGALMQAEAGDIKGASARFDRAIELGTWPGYVLSQLAPKSVVFMGRGTARLNLYDYQGAYDDNTTAIEADPKNARAYTGRGVARVALAKIHAAEGKRDVAVKELRAAIDDHLTAARYEPHLVGAYANCGTAYRELGRLTTDEQMLKKAVECLTRAIQLEPRGSSLYSGRGNAYLELRGFREAERDLTEAIRLDSANAMAYNNLGVLHRHLAKERNDPTETWKAIHSFREAIGHNDRSPETWFNLGAAYEDLGKWKLARSAYQKVMEVSQDLLVRAYAKAGLERLSTKH